MQGGKEVKMGFQMEVESQTLTKKDLENLEKGLIRIIFTGKSKKTKEGVTIMEALEIQDVSFINVPPDTNIKIGSYKICHIEEEDYEK